MFSCEFCLIFQNTFCAKHVWVVTASAKYHFLVASTASGKCLSRRWLYSAKFYKVHKKASVMDSRFHKAVSLHTTSVLRRTPSLAFSCEYTHLNIFVHCFILIEPFLFDLSLLISEQINIC